MLGVAVLGFALPWGVLAQEGEIVTKQYDDGSFYEGTFLNGRQHGSGTYTLPNGYSYSGEWVAGEILGQGVARYPN
ncbi:MAG: 2-isopropylmalate synthase, partial [Pseudotabrizicola sp.]|nr:2-isopropylmalate synthase [Pseudotabrizicola sp.]